MYRRSVVLALSACLLVVSSTGISLASADPQRTVGMLPIKVRGDFTGKFASNIERRLVSSLVDRGLVVYTRQQVINKVREVPGLSGCFSKSCLVEMSALLGAKRLLQLSIKQKEKFKNSTATYTVNVTTYSLAAEGLRTNTKSGDCTGCDRQTLLNMISHVATVTVEEELGAFQSVRLVTDPPGVRLYVNNKLVGASPCVAELISGVHKVHVRQKDYKLTTKMIHVRAGTGNDKQVFSIPVTPKDSNDPTPLSTADAKATKGSGKAWKWITGSAAVVSITAGVIFLDKDGKGTCDDGPNRVCPQVFDTRTQGWASLGVGAALAGMTTWLFVRDHRRNKKQKRMSVGILPTKGGMFGHVLLPF